MEGFEVVQVGDVDEIVAACNIREAEYFIPLVKEVNVKDAKLLLANLNGNYKKSWEPHYY